MAMLLGKKIGMTQVYDEAGKLLPVTVIQAGPCKVMQVKSVDSDGYNALQLGFDEAKESKRIKSAVGHAKKANAFPKRFVKEMKLYGQEPEASQGDELTVTEFSDAESVDVIGTSKGKGFAGGMKRHGFGGFPQSHGTKRKHRAPGSIASHASDAGKAGNVKKGKRMAGRMGGDRITSKNHRLVSIDEEKNLLVVKGSVPGAAGGYVIVRTSKKA